MPAAAIRMAVSSSFFIVCFSFIQGSSKTALSLSLHSVKAFARHPVTAIRVVVRDNVG